MKTYLKIITIISVLFFISCNKASEEKTYLSEMGIHLNDKYEILASSHSTAIGDQSIELKLKISDSDSQLIKQKIESTENFQLINETGSPNRSYQGPHRKIEMFGWKRNETYFYEIKKTTTKGFDYYNLSLLPENIITIQYSSE